MLGEEGWGAGMGGSSQVCPVPDHKQHRQLTRVRWDNRETQWQRQGMRWNDTIRGTESRQGKVLEARKGWSLGDNLKREHASDDGGGAHGEGYLESAGLDWGENVLGRGEFG